MNSKIIITLFLLYGELERDMIGLRTKETLVSKKDRESCWVNPRGLYKKVNKKRGLRADKIL